MPEEDTPLLTVTPGAEEINTQHPEQDWFIFCSSAVIVLFQLSSTFAPQLGVQGALWPAGDGAVFGERRMQAPVPARRGGRSCAASLPPY